MPAAVGSLALATEGRLVVALRSGVHLFNPGSDRLDLLVHPEPDMPCNRLNDGKVGPDGCFWVGSMHDSIPRQPTAALYRVSPDGTYSKVLDGLRNSNGLAWSPDGQTMFHADTRAPSVCAYDFDRVTGAISNRRLLAAPTELDGLPDGGAVDVDGNYWSAGITAGRLNKISPTGGIVASIGVPAPAPTMPCFGGSNLRTLFVTSLAIDTGSGPVAGTVHCAQSPVAGLPSRIFGQRYLS
jgi:sugar lactone lactonase YvrE